MKLTQAIKMAAKSISANKGRSALTMLGVIIGLAAVIILVSFAQGQNAAMEKYYESMGEYVLDVYAYSYYGGGSSLDIPTELSNYCKQISEYVEGVTPITTMYNNAYIQYGVQTMDNSDWNTAPQFYMANDQFGICQNFKIASGRELSYLDVKRENKVCVLGAAVADTLFGMVNPVGKTVTIAGFPFTVIGVYQAKGNGATYDDPDANWQDVEMSRMDRIVVMPYTLNRTMNNNQSPDSYAVKCRDSRSAQLAATQLRSFLEGLIGDQGYYDVYNNNVYQEEQGEANAMEQAFLGGIAAISLLVGGIGIMNIMLVTVTERTREIGIRKAIGAERKSIIAQFLIEAAMICGIGGILGILVGTVGTLIVGKLAFDTVLLPGMDITVGAFAISVALGIIFGMYPAAKASRLQPVDALRAD